MGRGLDFAVRASVYGKVSGEPNIKPDDQERKKGGKDACCLPSPGWLATYVGYVLMCPPVCVLGGGIHPTTTHRPHL